MSLFFRAWLAALTLALSSGAQAAWHEAKSKHFIIYSDLKPERLKQFAERIERFDKAVRHIREMDDPALTDSHRLTIYVLGSQGAVAKLVGAGSTVAGMYEARASGSVAFVSNVGTSSDDWDLDTEAIFFHEYAHHLQLQYSSVALPPWVVEGFAEFFATAKVNKDGSILIGSPPLFRAYSLFNGTGVSLEDMLGVTTKKLSPEQLDLLYGRAWLLTHYLTFNEGRRGQLTRYVDAIQQGKDALESAKAAFGDLKQLDRELDRYTRVRLTAVRVDGKALSIDPVQIRPLTAGEAAIMKVRIRSDRGVDSKTAPVVAADARKIATTYPTDPFVQGTLAEAEYDAGNYAAAEAAADRALAVNPSYVQALVYKGRVRLELAKANADKADWKDVRSWFTRANRLDTENAEPLMLFYESFTAAGMKPTKNAVDALLYALQLAPRDDWLRVMAVRQSLVDGQLTQAAKQFAPLAFQPHAPEQYRDSNARVMAALAAGDGKGALAALEAAMQAPGKEAEKP